MQYKIIILFILYTFFYPTALISQDLKDINYLRKRGFEIINFKSQENDTTNLNNNSNITNIQVRFNMNKNKIEYSKFNSNLNNIMSEDFEQEFPNDQWNLQGDPTWGVTDYYYFNGLKSAWCAAGGINALNPENSDYPNNCNSTMIYGPFCLKDAKSAELNFHFWLSTEINYDWFFYLASTDGVDFSGEGISGNSKGWKYESFKLNDVPEIGDLTGQDSVWIALIFISDGSGTKSGVYIDDISLIQSSWQKQESNSYYDLSDVFFNTYEKGWVVGSTTLLKTNNSGVDWIESPHYVDGKICSITFIDENNGWFVGWNGNVYRSMNAGETWDYQSGRIGMYFHWFKGDIEFINRDIGWAIKGGYLLKTDNRGKSWVTQRNIDISIYDFFFLNDEMCWVLGTDNTVMKTIDGGNTWTKLEPNPERIPSDVFFADEYNGWGWSYDGNFYYILKTSDGGNTWIEQHKDRHHAIECFHFFNSDSGLAVGDHNTILSTEDGGENWEVISFAGTETYHSIFFVDKNVGWIAGEGEGPRRGVIRKTTDGGKSWSFQTCGTDHQLHKIYFINSNIGWAIGSGVMLKTTNGGESWIKLNIKYCLVAIYFQNENEGFVYSDYGDVIETNNGGLDWHSSKFGMRNDLKSVYFSSPNVGFICGNDVIYKTINQGTEWYVNQRAENKINSLFFCDENTGWAVGLFSVLKTEDGGETWTQLANVPEHGFNSCFFIDSNIGWIVGNFGAIFKTIDGGETWMNQSNNEFSFGFNKVVFIDKNCGWIVGDSGTILKTNNSGNTWEKIASGTLEHLNSIFFTNENNGWIVGNRGTILHTSNSGIVVSVEETAFNNNNNHAGNYLLIKNYPNPFNSTTLINYNIPQNDAISMNIYNIEGKLVKNLLKGKYHSKGVYCITWDGKDNIGNFVSSGAYFVQIQVDDLKSTKKMLLLK